MTSIVSAIIAVVGTLLGATTTYVFQRIDADRKDRIARNERFRQERLAVYTELAAAVTDLRRAAHDRWHRHQDDRMERRSQRRGITTTGCTPWLGTSN
jgi:hypothetical protein